MESIIMPSTDHRGDSRTGLTTRAERRVGSGTEASLRAPEPAVHVAASPGLYDDERSGLEYPG